MTSRRRNLFVILLMLGLLVALGRDHRHQGDQARPRPEGRRRAGLPGRADPAERGHARGDRPRDRHHARARRPAGCRGARDPAARQRPDLGRPAGRQEPRARQEAGRHDRPAATSTTGSATSIGNPQTPIDEPLRGGQARVAAPAADGRQQHHEGAVLPLQGEQDARRRPGRVARRTCCPSSTAASRRATRSSRCPPGTVVLRAERPENLPTTRRSSATSWCATTRSCAAPTSRTRAQESDPTTERADRHLQLHRQGAQELPGGHAPPGRARADAPGPGPAGGELVPDLRDRARPRGGLAAVHRLPREPGRHRRAHGRADLGRLQAPGGAGPRRRPEDRRAADQPEADQRDAGLRHARQAGPARGPPRRRVGFGLVLLFLLALLPPAGRDRRRRAAHLRGPLLRADQADPDHADPARHRGTDPHDRHRGRLQHRHLRTHQGGAARRADRRCRRSRPATSAASRRSSTRTSSR